MARADAMGGLWLRRARAGVGVRAPPGAAPHTRDTTHESHVVVSVVETPQTPLLLRTLLYVGH